MAQKTQKFILPDSVRSLELFEAVSHFDSLWIGWQKVKANQGAMGGDGITVGEFDAHAPNRVSRLAHALATGRYRTAAFREVFIPKKSGGLRKLTIPSVADRVVQASTALVLGPVFEREFEPSSFAYRPGRSVTQAIARIAQYRKEGYRFVVDGDIVSYFDNIPHDPLIALLDRHVPSARLVDLIAMWLEAFSDGGRGVPQGSPLSPLLANLYLDHVDEQIEGRGIRLVRYADDFVILCKEEHVARTAMARMAELLAEAGLKLHPDKTSIRSFDQGFRFLGHVMVRSMTYKEMSFDETPSEELIEASERVLADAARQATETVEQQRADNENAPRGRWSARRRVLYVLEPGRRLAASGQHFLVQDGDAELLELPAGLVHRIELGPLADAGMDALDLAAEMGIEVIRMNGHGIVTGRWEHPAPGRAQRHLKQAAFILDPQQRGSLARAFVAGRIANQRALLKRLDRRVGDAELQPVSVKLGRLQRRMERGSGDAGEAMAREGEAAALYWPMLARQLALPWAFKARRRRQLGFDAFNTTLDILSSMLLRECRAALQRSGLHTGFPALHSADDHEDALAYDLAEEFRAPLVEAVAFGLFKRRALREDSFIETPNGLRVTQAGWAATIRGFEGALDRPIRDPQDGEEHLWRGIIDNQAERLARTFETGENYRSYRMDF